MKNGFFRLGCLVTAIAHLTTAVADYDITYPHVSEKNLAIFQNTYDLAQYANAPVQTVKIAVVDLGFKTILRTDPKTGKQKIIKGSLPSSSYAVKDFSAYAKDMSLPEDIREKFEICPKKAQFDDADHGAVVAQSAWAQSYNKKEGPQFMLLNGHDRYNFYCSFWYATYVDKADIIVMAQNFNMGGRFDGTGPINDVVDEATAKGILVIVSAGNNAGKVYNGPVKDRTILHIKSNSDDNKAQIDVSWDGEDGSGKDLDVSLTADDGSIVPMINQQQVVEKKGTKVIILRSPADRAKQGTATETPPANDTGDQPVAAAPAPEKAEIIRVADQDEETENRFTTPFLFESNSVTLGQKTYTLEIVRRSGHFAPSDNLRVTVLTPVDRMSLPAETSTPDRQVSLIELVEATNSKEIPKPADGKDVVTVGDTKNWTSRGPTMDGRTKPDILVETAGILMTSGGIREGASFATAILAGIAVPLMAIAKSMGTVLDPKTLISFAKAGRVGASMVQMPSQQSLPQGARMISMDEFKLGEGSNTLNQRDINTHLAWQLSELAPGVMFQPFVMQDGYYILGMKDSPVTLQRVFTHNNLGWDNRDRAWYWISAHLVQNPEFPNDANRRAWRPMDFTALRDDQAYPWQLGLKMLYTNGVQSGPDLARGHFVEIRKIDFLEQTIPARNIPNLWVTPSVADLKLRLKENALKE